MKAVENMAGTWQKKWKIFVMEQIKEKQQKTNRVI